MREEVDPYPWLLRSQKWGFWVKLGMAVVVLIPTLPLIMGQMVVSILWHAVNEMVGGVMGRFVAGASMGRMRKMVVKWGVVSNVEDFVFVPWLVWLVLCVPGMFFYVLFRAWDSNKTPWGLIALYSQLRLGPLYAGFMWMYVLCHKEAHCYGRLLKWAHKDQWYVCNYWAGLFHGVLPGVFNISHVRNHHRYENGARDLHTTAYLRRDRLSSLLVYLIDWLAYASNVSGMAAFMTERNWPAVRELATGICMFVAVVMGVGCIDPFVAMFCVVYPFIEANVLLCCVNFVWHAFIEKERLYDDRISSTTVVEGKRFTLGEEFHVVHHIKPGVHWTRHGDIFWETIEKQKKKEEEKEEMLLTIFFGANLFEILYFIVAGDVSGLADRLYKPLVPTTWDRERVEQTLRERLVTAGPEVALAVGNRPVGDNASLTKTKRL